MTASFTSARSHGSPAAVHSRTANRGNGLPSYQKSLGGVSNCGWSTSTPSSDAGRLSVDGLDGATGFDAVDDCDCAARSACTSLR